MAPLLVTRADNADVPVRPYPETGASQPPRTSNEHELAVDDKVRLYEADIKEIKEMQQTMAHNQHLIEHALNLYGETMHDINTRVGDVGVKAQVLDAWMEHLKAYHECQSLDPEVECGMELLSLPILGTPGVRKVLPFKRPSIIKAQMVDEENERNNVFGETVDPPEPTQPQPSLLRGPLPAFGLQLPRVTEPTPESTPEPAPQPPQEVPQSTEPQQDPPEPPFAETPPTPEEWPSYQVRWPPIPEDDELRQHVGGEASDPPAILLLADLMDQTMHTQNRSRDSRQMPERSIEISKRRVQQRYPLKGSPRTINPTSLLRAMRLRHPNWLISHMNTIGNLLVKQQNWNITLNFSRKSRIKLISKLSKSQNMMSISATTTIN